jgi:hypothetical protein
LFPSDELSDDESESYKARPLNISEYQHLTHKMNRTGRIVNKTYDRVSVVGAHFVTIRLALNSTFDYIANRNSIFWQLAGRKFPSSSTLLDVRYVPSPYRPTTVTQLWATKGKY